jgi:diphosphomevalonate decarboxylase
MTTSTTARAPSNIALIKYWGKRAGVDPGLNLPAVGSISVSLKALHTTTTVTPDPDLKQDEVVLYEGKKKQEIDANFRERICKHLGRLRSKAPLQCYCRIKSRNNFPTGAGLASSASGFAALTLAASRALGLSLRPHELSALARMGSGSAARSVFGGFVEMQAGRLDDGSDAVARSLASAESWPLKVLVAITQTQPKEVGSTEGMQLTARTSPYYTSWIESQPKDLVDMQSAIRRCDFEALTHLSEHSALKMHALMFSSKPGLIYWRGSTLEVIHEIRSLRSQGTSVCFTSDAGPQVKALCEKEDAAKVMARLKEIPGVLRVIESDLGDGAHIQEG